MTQCTQLQEGGIDKKNIPRGEEKKFHCQVYSFLDCPWEKKTYHHQGQIPIQCNHSKASEMSSQLCFN